MFERPEKLKLHRRLARAIDIARCEGLTRAQRLARALAWALAGAAIGAGALAFFALRFPTEVTVLEPAQHRGEHFLVVRFRFAHRGAESSCFAVLYHESQTWSVECP